MQQALNNTTILYTMIVIVSIQVLNTVASSYLLSYSPGGSTGREFVPRGCIWDPHLGEGPEGEVVGGSDGTCTIRKSMVVSYMGCPLWQLCCLAIWPQFAVECLRSWNQQGWVTLRQNSSRKGLTNVSQFLTRSGSDNSCRVQKSWWYLLSFEHNARTWQTGRHKHTDYKTVTIIAIGEVACQRCRLKAA